MWHKISWSWAFHVHGIIKWSLVFFPLLWTYSDLYISILDSPVWSYYTNKQIDVEICAMLSYLVNVYCCIKLTGLAYVFVPVTLSSSLLVKNDEIAILYQGVSGFQFIWIQLIVLTQLQHCTWIYQLMYELFDLFCVALWLLFVWLSAIVPSQQVQYTNHRHKDIALVLHNLPEQIGLFQLTRIISCLNTDILSLLQPNLQSVSLEGSWWNIYRKFLNSKWLNSCKDKIDAHNLFSIVLRVYRLI